MPGPEQLWSFAGAEKSCRYNLLLCLWLTLMHSCSSDIVFAAKLNIIIRIVRYDCTSKEIGRNVNKLSAIIASVAQKYTKRRAIVFFEELIHVRFNIAVSFWEYTSIHDLLVIQPNPGSSQTTTGNSCKEQIPPQELKCSSASPETP